MRRSPRATGSRSSRSSGSTRTRRRHPRVPWPRCSPPVSSRSRCPSTRPRTTAGSSTPRRRATASRARSCSWGPARTRSSTSCQDVHPARRLGARAGPHLPDVRNPHRAARRVGRARAAATGVGVYALDVEGVRAAVRAAEPAIDLIWLCNPNNPTARAEPAGVVAALLSGLLADAAATGRREPVVLLDEAYVEFGGDSDLPLRAAYPRLVVTRTMSKAYAIAGLRVGFGIARPELIDEISDVSAAGLRLDRVGRGRGRAPAGPGSWSTTASRRSPPNAPGSPRPRDAGWDVQAIRDELRAGELRLARGRGRRRGGPAPPRAHPAHVPGRSSAGPLPSPDGARTASRTTA